MGRWRGRDDGDFVGFGGEDSYLSIRWKRKCQSSELAKQYSLLSLYQGSLER